MADDVGEHGGSSVLRLLLAQANAAGKALQFHFLGHSFGCRVVTSSLESLLDGVGRPALEAHKFNLVLLQGAFDSDALEPGKIYGRILDSTLGIPNLRILVTKSAEDRAVGTEYPRAWRLVHLFGKTVTGIGATGPTASTPGAAGALQASVGPGFQPQQVANLGSAPLVVADLTTLHKDGTVPGDKFSGHHSDIYRPEIYRLICAFLF